MTDYQEALVLENLDLVNWVIRTRISIPNRPLLTYDDFYAIGCEAICRAALKYQPDMGAFAPFACRYIYNAIVDHCRAMNYRLERSVEISEDENTSLLDISPKQKAIVLKKARRWAGLCQLGLESFTPIISGFTACLVRNWSRRFLCPF